MKNQPPARDPRDDLAGQIVLCRTQPSGRNDDAGSLEGMEQNRLDVFWKVPDDCLIADFDPELEELIGEKERVCVSGPSEQ